MKGSPLGALLVLGMLVALALQSGNGLFSDDEISVSDPLTRFAPNDTVSQASSYHAGGGQYLVLALVALHLLATTFYALVKRNNLVRPMVGGDKVLPLPAPAARDDATTRSVALSVPALCAAAATWLVQLGGGCQSLDGQRPHRHR